MVLAHTFTRRPVTVDASVPPEKVRSNFWLREEGDDQKDFLQLFPSTESLLFNSKLCIINFTF